VTTSGSTTGSRLKTQVAFSLDRTSFTTACGWVTVFVLMVAFRGDVLGWQLRPLEVASAALALSALVTIASVAARRCWSAGFVYVLMLTLFHLGLTSALAFGFQPKPELAAYLSLWLTGHTIEAIYLCDLALVALTVAYLLGRQRRSTTPDVTYDQHATSGPWFSIVGVVLVAASTLIYLYTARASFGGAYSAYFETTGSSGSVAYTTLGMAIGSIFVAVGSPGTARRAGFAFMGAYMIGAALIGSRTIFMFPVMAALTAAGQTGKRLPSAKVAVVGFVLALSVIGIIRDVRAEGPSLQALSAANVNPASALAELGSTLRPVVETVGWRRTLGEPPKRGVTYVAPLLRLKDLALDRPRPEGRADERYAYTLVTERVPVYAIGYSAVAEAFLNFGTPGVVIIFALLGWLLSVADRRSRGPAGGALVGIVLFSLLLAVRNASNAMLFELVVGFLAVQAVLVLSRLRGRVVGGEPSRVALTAAGPAHRRPRRPASRPSSPSRPVSPAASSFASADR
jgi:hypothetical protein